jgi:uncharacterized membrane protein YkoI
MGRTVERGETERQLKMAHPNLTVAVQHANALGLAVVISTRSTALIVLCAAAAATGAALVSASASSTHPAPASFVLPRSGMSMDQAVRMVEERYHARVVKAEAQHDEGHTVYVLRLLNDAGKVWTVRVDPLNGAVQQ